MRFTEIRLSGAYVIELEPRQDARGFFARAFCRREFEAYGLNPRIAQANVALSHARGTLRGLHYQVAPFEETKVVRCTRGSVFDVMVDLRPGSPTYCQWVGEELSAASRRMLYVPAGFAHGYQTLEDDTELFYLVSECYSPEHERGVRWNDSAFGIRWPLAEPIVSPKDQAFPDFRT